MITKQMILSSQLFLVTQKHIQRDQFTTVTKQLPNCQVRFLWAVSLKWIKNMQHEQFPKSTTNDSSETGLFNESTTYGQLTMIT